LSSIGSLPVDINDIQNDIYSFLKQELELFGDELAMPTASLSRSAVDASSIVDDADWERANDLQSLYLSIKDCQKCPLGKQRTNFVFGEGNPNADIVLVGEAPGAEEDRQGIPFVGKAGQLLDKILAAIGFSRQDVYICNILKCRPPSNRDPLPSEIELCRPYLHKQLDLIKPEFILCLGRIAVQTLLNTEQSLSSLRGKVHEFRGSRLIATYHPAALLRYPQYKRPTWEDVQLLRKLYDEWKNIK